MLQAMNSTWGSDGADEQNMTKVRAITAPPRDVRGSSLSYNES
jgi:hypothetical protein